MTQMAKWKELSDIGIPISTPSPEAIVRAALGRAAKLFDQDADDMRKEGNSFYWTAEMDAERICSLASDPAEVAAIISAASQLNKAGNEINERSEEEGRG
jgi:hypothetical protein